jgi:hypothetical protein
MTQMGLRHITIAAATIATIAASLASIVFMVAACVLITTATPSDTAPFDYFTASLVSLAGAFFALGVLFVLVTFEKWRV